MDSCPQSRCSDSKPYLDIMLTQSTSNMFVFCQNKSFGCTWQGLYGDGAKHLAENCSACKPDQLLRLLEDSESREDESLRLLAEASADSALLKDDLALLKAELEMANKRAADRLGEKYVFEAEAAYLTKELAKKKTQVAEMTANASKLEGEVTQLENRVKALEEEAQAVREHGDHASQRILAAG